MNIKRISALFLTAVMLLTSFAVYAENDQTTAADSVTAPVEVINSGEFHALYAMGFLCDDLAETDKNAYITRAQFAGYLCKLAGYAVSERTTGEIPFGDVNVSMPYCNEICTMYEAGIVSGTDENMFSPDEYVTYAQACKMIGDVLGYGNYARVKYGEYPESYVMMAQELDIDDGVSNASQNSQLTAENAVRMLYNAGLAEVMTLSGFDKNGNPTYSSDGTTLLELNDIYYGEGIMQTNGITSIIAIPSETTTNVTMISDERFESAETDFNSLVGSRIKYFYKKNDADKKLLWAWEDTRFNKSVEYKAADLAITSPDYSRSNIVYYKSNGETKSLKIESPSYVIYNNELIPIPDDELLKIKSGTMRLVDNDNDDKYEIIIINEYKNMFVVTNSTKSESLVDKYDNSVDLEKYDVAKIYKDGVEIDKDKVAVNSVISFIENPSKTHIYMYVSTDHVSGVISGAKTKRGVTIYTIDGKEYKISQTFAELMESGKTFVTPEIGKEYNFWLDINGEIAEIQEGTGSLRYALFTEASRGNIDGTDTVYATMTFTDGSMNKVIISKELKFNGKKMKISELYNDGVSDYSSKSNYSKLFSESGAVKEQVIKVSFKEDGTVKEIETAADNTDNTYGHDSTRFTLDGTGSHSMTSADSTRLVEQKWLINNAVTFFVKYDGAGYDPSWGTVSYSSVNAGTQNMQIYDVSDNMVPKVVYLPSTIDREKYWAENSFLVESIEWTFEDGEELKKISGYEGTVYKSYVELERGDLPDNIEEGDVLRVSRFNNRLTAVTKYFNVKNGDTDGFINGALTAERCMLYAPVYSISTNGLCVLTPTASVASVGSIITSGFYGTRQTMLIYDRETGEVTTGDYTSLDQIVSPNADGTLPESDKRVMVFMRRRYGVIREALIVK